LPDANGGHKAGRDDGVGSSMTAPSTRATRDRVVELDVSWLVPADLGIVDALARLQVAASRSGCWLQFHGADGGLAELLEFVGLGDVVHLCSSCDGSRGSVPNARDEGDGRATALPR